MHACIDLTSHDELDEFLSESAIMKDFHHPNVLGLVGVVFDTPDGVPYLVLPLMELGNLKHFLKTKRMEDSNFNELPQVSVVNQVANWLLHDTQHAGLEALRHSQNVH